MKTQWLVRDKQFYKMLAAIGLPIILQQLISVGVNLADNVMLGQLGEVQMSGATLANNFISIFQICCMGLGMGASVLTSRFWGMQDMKSLKQAVNIMYRLTVILALLFSVVTAVIPAQIMRLYSSEKMVIACGVSYLLISIPCYFIHGLSLTSSLILRSVGRASIPLYASIGSFFINIFFNWIFIFGHLGAPRMEVSGAALGTLLARIFEFSLTLGYFFFKEKKIHMRLSDLKMKCQSLMKEYISVCIPVLASDTLLGVGNSMVAVVMGHVGADFVAANAIVSVTQQMSTVVIQGMSQAGCAITGITLGRGEKEKAQKQGMTFLFIALAVGCFGCLLIYVLKKPIIGLYNITSGTKFLAGELMNATCIVVIFQCTNSVLTKGVLRGGGDTKFLMVADILFLWCASIPLGALAGIVWHWPGFWIMICLKTDQFIKAVWCVFRLNSGKWIKGISGSK